MPRHLHRPLTDDELSELKRFVSLHKGETQFTVRDAWNAAHSEQADPPLVTAPMVLYHQQTKGLKVSAAARKKQKEQMNRSRKQALESRADERALESVAAFRERARLLLLEDPAQDPVFCQFCTLHFPKTAEFFQEYVKSGVTRLDTAHCKECRKERRRAARREQTSESPPSPAALKRRQTDEKRKRSDQRLERRKAAAAQHADQAVAGSQKTTDVCCGHSNGRDETPPTRRCLTCPGVFLLNEESFRPTKWGFAYRCKFCESNDRRNRKRLRQESQEHPAQSRNGRRIYSTAPKPDHRTRAKRIRTLTAIGKAKSQQWKQLKLLAAAHLLEVHPDTPKLDCPLCGRTLPLLPLWFQCEDGRYRRNMCVICKAEARPRGPLGQIMKKLDQLKAGKTGNCPAGEKPP